MKTFLFFSFFLFYWQYLCFFFYAWIKNSFNQFNQNFYCNAHLKICQFFFFFGGAVVTLRCDIVFAALIPKEQEQQRWRSVPEKHLCWGELQTRPNPRRRLCEGVWAESLLTTALRGYWWCGLCWDIRGDASRAGSQGNFPCGFHFKSSGRNTCSVLSQSR